MDLFLDKLTQQAVNYAIRSGVTLTASYALRQTGRLLSAVENSSERQELQVLQDKLQSKIRIISPAIDMIELISARGNTTLESAVELTSRIRSQIQSIAQRLEQAATNETLARKGGGRASSKTDLDRELKGVIGDLRRLLSQIEDAVPFLNLALTTSGAKLSTELPQTVSPSRLLQASTFLTAADSSYARHEGTTTQVGPTFTLSLYMLFGGHLRPQYEEDVRSSTWKEVVHKARVKLMRVPLDSLGLLHCTEHHDQHEISEDAESVRASTRGEEYAYQILIIEDFDDDRVHDFEDGEQPSAYEGVPRSGIKEAIPIHEVAKIFYADTGKILNIGGEGDVHRPVLLLKRDLEAAAPRRIATRLAEPGWSEETSGDPVQSALDAQLMNAGNSELSESLDAKENSPNTAKDWRIPADLDPEWLALEVYIEASDSEEEESEDEGRGVDASGTRAVRREGSTESEVVTRLANVKLRSPSPVHKGHLSQSLMLPSFTGSSGQDTRGVKVQVKTSLSLMEILLRLTSLQQFQQATHLSIEDEFLNFFLSESATVGAAGGDQHERRALREEARRRVGFDPYDESPIKRRGEQYQYHSEEEPPEQAGEAYAIQSVEKQELSPRPLRKSSATSRRQSGRLSGSDFPPMRLRNSPRSSRQGTPEKRSPGFPSPNASPLTSHKMPPSRLSREAAGEESPT